MIPFIDIYSASQGNVGIDWSAVAKYLLSKHPEAGVIIKVSQGDWYVNPYLHQQREGAHAAGIKNVGLYYYGETIAQGGTNVGKPLSGSNNAEFFYKCMGNDGGIVKNEFIAFDIEDVNPLLNPTADLDAWVLDANDNVFRALGLRQFVYTGAWYADPHNLNRDPKLALNPLWWAAYQQTIPPVPAPWQKISMWQFSSTGMIPGISVQVDLDWFIGTIDELRQYQWGYSQPLPPVPIDPPPDVPVNPTSENITDANTVALKISQDALALANKYPEAYTEALQIKADADLIAKITWGH